MIIDTVEISNLGLWENIFLKFDKGINIIQGENGAGKTTLLALLYSLFRDSGIIKFTNENQECKFRLIRPHIPLRTDQPFRM